MGAQQSCEQCQSCPSCTCPTCPTFSSCDTSIIEDGFAKDKRDKIQKYNLAKEQKETTITNLGSNIDDLKNQFESNGTLILTLKEDIQVSGKTVLSGKYVKGKDACEKERISERKKTLACESDNKAPILNQRNTSCKKVRNVVNTLLTANGNGLNARV